MILLRCKMQYFGTKNSNEHSRYGISCYFGIKSKIYLIQYKTQLIGVISFNRIDPANQEVDIGYWLAQDWQGKGIVSQCLTGLSDMHKGIYQHFVLKCAVKNVKSNAVARRNGFTFCERLPQAECLNGVYYDQNKYVKHIMA